MDDVIFVGIVIPVIILGCSTGVSGSIHRGSNPQIVVGELDEQLQNMTSEQGVEYKISFYKNNLTLRVVAINTQKEIVSAGIGIEVDEQRLNDFSFQLDSKELRTMVVGLNSTVRVLRANHTVSAHTFGSSIEFHWNDKYAVNGSIPVPKIENVSVKNGTIDGEPSTVAEVTVANPSKQTYPTKLMVHTTGTDGSFYGAPVPPGETRTITVELLEERGTTVAGEARLYTEGLNKREGAMDQVEFVGRAGADTRHWNTSYEPVRPPWVEDSYRYRNSSVTGDGGLLPGEAGSWWVYAVAGVVLLVWLVRKVR